MIDDYWKMNLGRNKIKKDKMKEKRSSISLVLIARRYDNEICFVCRGFILDGEVVVPK